MLSDECMPHGPLQSRCIIWRYQLHVQCSELTATSAQHVDGYHTAAWRHVVEAVHSCGSLPNSGTASWLVVQTQAQATTDFVEPLHNQSSISTCSLILEAGTAYFVVMEDSLVS